MILLLSTSEFRRRNDIFSRIFTSENRRARRYLAGDLILHVLQEDTLLLGNEVDLDSIEITNVRVREIQLGGITASVQPLREKRHFRQIAQNGYG